MNSSSNSWKVCGGVDAPKDEIVYCCQVFVAFVVILAGLVNLTFTESDTCLWTGLISGATFYPIRRFVAMSRFHLTLPSNSSMHYYPQNTLRTPSVHDETDQHD